MKVIYVYKNGIYSELDVPDEDNTIEIMIMLKYYALTDLFTVSIRPTVTMMKHCRKNLKRHPNLYEYAFVKAICEKDPWAIENWTIDDRAVNDMSSLMKEHYDLKFPQAFKSWHSYNCNADIRSINNGCAANAEFYSRDVIITHALHLRVHTYEKVFIDSKTCEDIVVYALSLIHI